jgi:transposase
MSKTYRLWNPHQQGLLPPCPQDWLPQGDLVYFLLDTVNELDISAILQKYEQEERGYPPYHPRMMVALLFYAYCRGLFSSRKIRQACEERLTFRVIVGDDIPDFRTISDFRKLHLKELSDLFLQVLRLCQEAGLVRLGHIALDGTKIKANASRHKAMSYGRMKEEEKRLQGEIRELLAQAEAADEQEDRDQGRDRRGDELPEELARRESRLQRIRKAQQALEAQAQAVAEQTRREQEALGEERKDAPAQGGGRAQEVSEVPAEKKQYNFTDPESKIMKVSNKGWDQCGNAQAAVDGHQQIIVACDVTDQPNDKQQFASMLTQAQEKVGPEHKIQGASADSGYSSEANVQYAESQGIDAYLATERLKHADRVAKCPRGRMAKDLTVKEKMARKLRTKKGRQRYSRRKCIVEPVFGQIKRARGFVQFSLRGLTKMRGEWSLVCLTHNLLKLFAARCARAA